MIILSVIQSVTTSYTLSVEYNPKFDKVYGAIGIFVLIISILLNITLLFWYYRATKNIRSFGAKEVTSPRMAVIWWLIPIAFLWKPYQVAQQIWKASDPEIKLVNGVEWKSIANSKIVKRWWFLTLANIFGSLFAGVSGGIGFVTLYNSDPELFGESTQASLFQGILSIPFLILGIISTYYFIRVVMQISKRQYLKSLS